MRSQIFLAAALLTTAVFAQREMPNRLEPDIAKNSKPDITGTVQITGHNEGPGSVVINGGPDESPMVAISLDRSLLDAIQGNLDRESIERTNGETR